MRILGAIVSIVNGRLVLDGVRHVGRLANPNTISTARAPSTDGASAEEKGVVCVPRASAARVSFRGKVVGELPGRRINTYTGVASVLKLVDGVSQGMTVGNKGRSQLAIGDKAS